MQAETPVGADKIMLKGVMFVLASLILSPFLGLIFGAIVLRATLYFSRNASPEIKKTFSRLQIVSSLALALSHGANDAQKSMGVITMAFRAGFGLRKYLPSYPAWPPLMRFLFVGPALCLRLPLDPTSRWAPLPAG